MASAAPHAAFHFHGQHVNRPGQVKPPFALGVELIFSLRRG